MSSLPVSTSVPRALSEDAEGLIAALGAVNEDQTLGRYELLLPIGRGGMAIVWAARLRGTHRFTKTVAVKTMLPALSADPRFERMFLAEAEIASRIKHPNVCEILDLGEDRGVLYLVMEWIDGEPLSTLLRMATTQDRAVPYGVAAAIAAGAARGLHAAHEPFGVVHRDVSPQNILVTMDGRVKIVDFGVAKAAQRTGQATESGFIKGKVAYLAPEQVRSPDVDARADVFALGTVLYELTTGVHPFRGGTDLDTLLRIAASDAAAAPAAPDYPEALRAIVQRALEKDPAKRYPSMRELASDLEAYVATTLAAEPAADVAAFVGEILGDRRKRRAAELEDAMREADARAERRRLTPEEPIAAVHPPKPRRTIASVVGVGLIGIGIGALAVRAAQGSPRAVTHEPAPIVTSSTNVVASSSVATPTPSSAPTASTVPSAVVSTILRPVTVSRPPRATPSATEVPARPAPPPTAASSAPPPTRFRQPGF